jgi:nucleoside-diphosphate kinase
MDEEKTLVFVKPRNEDITREVFAYFDSLLMERIRFSRFPIIYELENIPEDVIGEHYWHLKKVDEQVFRATVEAYRAGRIFLTWYSGREIIKTAKRCVGDTSPEKAEPWTIRGKFRKDSLKDAFREKRYLNNVIHASKDSIEARKDLALWISYIDSLEDDRIV